MAVLLLVLKWIGLLLTAIIVLLLFVLVCALFSPIRYRLSFEYFGKPIFFYTFRWLGIVSIKQRKGSNSVILCIFGIPVKRFGESVNKKTSRDKSSKDERRKASDRAGENAVERVKDASQRCDKIQKTTGKKKKRLREKKGLSFEKEKEEEKISWKKKLSFPFRRVSSIIRFIRKKENKLAFQMVIWEVRKLVKYSSPKKIKGKVVFGTGDPSSTGLALGGLSLLPWIYKKELEITPDFEQRRLEGRLELTGRIRVIYLLRLFLRLYQHKELKRTIKEWRKM